MALKYKKLISRKLKQNGSTLFPAIIRCNHLIGTTLRPPWNESHATFDLIYLL